MGKGTKHIFLKKTSKWPTGTWEDAQHHYSSEKCKTEHKEISSHTFLNGYYQKEEIKSVGEDVEKMEPLCTVGGM